MAQVRLIVNAPASVAREISTLGKPANDGSWGFGDIDTMRIRTADVACVVLPDDSLACSPLAPGSMAGKIAIVHRGTCEFGCKAKAAQDAGAIACIIINNQPAMINMSGGACGADVMIPTLLIDQTEGNSIKAAICANGNITMGTYRGVFANNIGIDKATGAASPMAAAYPNGYIQDTMDYVFQPSIFIDNNGNADQNNVLARATINLIYSPTQPYPQQVYKDSTVIPSIQRADQPRDTAEVFFNVFDIYDAVANSDRRGIYELVYQIESPNGDEFPGDNVVRYQFRITEEMFSLVPLNPNTNDIAQFNPISPSVTGLAPTNRVFKFGPVMNTPTLGAGQSVFIDSVRLAVSAGDTVDFTALQINVEVHKWVDADANGGIAETELTQVGNGLLAFSDVSEKGKFISVGIDDAVTGDPGPIALEPNTTYLILAAYRGDDMVSFSSGPDDYAYERYYNNHAGLVSPVFVNQWYSGFTDTPVAGFRIDLSGSIVDAVATKPSLNQIAVSVYPNPSRDYLNVQLDQKVSATATIEVQDLNGRTLKAVAAGSAETTRINTRDLSNGIYQMVIRSAEGVAVKKFAIAK